MYSRFVVILKFLQLLGYIGALILAGIYAKVYALLLSGINDKVFFLVFAIFLCLANYMGTQIIIAVIALLNRIETNTRNPRQN
jgi:hypothetical protein